MSVFVGHTFSLAAIMKTIRFLSTIISAVFSPVVLPVATFSALVAADKTMPIERKWLVWTIAFVSTTLVISAYVAWLKMRGEIGSYELDLREERRKPFFVGLASNFIGFVLLYTLHAPPLITWLMFCYVSNTLLIYLITYRWKVSVHATSIGGAVVAWAFQFGAVVVAPWFLLVPLVSVSRVVLHKHTVGQVIVGSLIGLVLTALQLRYFM
jgi:membrane-associated phospholipid phosphatase